MNFEATEEGGENCLSVTGPYTEGDYSVEIEDEFGTVVSLYLSPRQLRLLRKAIQQEELAHG